MFMPGPEPVKGHLLIYQPFRFVESYNPMMDNLPLPNGWNTVLNLLRQGVQVGGSRVDFETIFTTLPSPIWYKDTRNVYQRANPHFCRVLGRAAEAIEGHSAEELFPALAGQILADDREVCASRQPKTGILEQLRTASGDLRLLLVDKYPLLDETGAATGVVAFGKDITAQHKAELQVQRLTDLLKESQALACVGGWEIDLEDDSLLWTDETYRIHDLSPGEFTPTVAAAIAFYAPGSLPVIQIAVQEAVAHNLDFDLELELITAKGRRIWVQATGRPIRHQGRTVKIVGAFRDITEKRKAQDQIQELAASLEQRVRDRTAQLEATIKELEAFSYSVSHDLRGPLRGLDGFSHALMEDYPDRLDATGRHYLTRIRAGVRHMGQLIDDLLKLSRINRMDLELSEVDQSSLWETVLAGLAEASPERRVEVIIQPEMRVRADPRLLMMALANLLGNAWKFTARRADPRIEVGERNIGEAGRVFFIRDNGAGFDMTYAGKLFNAFQRLHAGEDFEGTGIGLAIVQRIIHRHGGRIWVEAGVGSGATFFFTLPESAGGTGDDGHRPGNAPVKLV